jgi:DNA invertase Pin-like site-specific DNA recombinase
MQSLITPVQTRPAISYQRFSRAEQAYGTSEERQGSNTLGYCKKMGFHLLDVFFDRGVSGFKGRHRKKGQLADLILAVQQGKIAPDTVLIVENLDRLSREAVNIALQQFLELINDYKLEIQSPPTLTVCRRWLRHRLAQRRIWAR